MAIAKLPEKKKHEDKATSQEQTSFGSNAINFIESAPDGTASRPRKLKGRRVVITHTIKPEDLEKLDRLAESMDMKRAQLINLLIQKALVKEDFL